MPERTDWHLVDVKTSPIYLCWQLTVLIWALWAQNICFFSELRVLDVTCNWSQILRILA